MLNINLYLGAHKTATTHLQGILMANRGTLSSGGVKLSAPQDVRKEWLPKFFKYCNNMSLRNDAQLKRELVAIAPQEGLWILTEENIAGVSNDFAIKPGMYPAAADRIKCILELFGEANISFFFSLRSYDSFYRSAYSEVVRNRGYIPFEDFYDESRFKHNSWYDMVRKICDVLPADKVVLWKFENFRELMPQLLQRMTGIDNVQPLIDAYKAETTRPSLSQKTIDILADLHKVLDRNESLALVERINRAYATSAGYPAYRAFPPEQEEKFAKQYENDIQRIKTEFPGIFFLEP
jgi:ribulose bisphosphate carboxylase small subunit